MENLFGLQSTDDENRYLNEVFGLLSTADEYECLNEILGLPSTDDKCLKNYLVCYLLLASAWLNFFVCYLLLMSKLDGLG